MGNQALEMIGVYDLSHFSASLGVITQVTVVKLGVINAWPTINLA